MRGRKGSLAKPVKGTVGKNLGLFFQKEKSPNCQHVKIWSPFCQSRNRQSAELSCNHLRSDLQYLCISIESTIVDVFGNFSLCPGEWVKIILFVQSLYMSYHS